MLSKKRKGSLCHICQGRGFTLYNDGKVKDVCEQCAIFVDYEDATEYVTKLLDAGFDAEGVAEITADIIARASRKRKDRSK